MFKSKWRFHLVVFEIISLDERFFLTTLYLTVCVCALLTMRASSEKKERDSMYIRLTTTKLLFVVNIASRRHTQCVKRRKSLTKRAYIRGREKDMRETEVEPNRSTKILWLSSFVMCVSRIDVCNREQIFAQRRRSSSL